MPCRGATSAAMNSIRACSGGVTLVGGHHQRGAGNLVGRHGIGEEGEVHSDGTDDDHGEDGTATPGPFRLAFEFEAVVGGGVRGWG